MWTTNRKTTLKIANDTGTAKKTTKDELQKWENELAQLSPDHQKFENYNCPWTWRRHTHTAVHGQPEIFNHQLTNSFTKWSALSYKPRDKEKTMTEDTTMTIEKLNKMKAYWFENEIENLNEEALDYFYTVRYDLKKVIAALEEELKNKK